MEVVTLVQVMVGVMEKGGGWRWSGGPGDGGVVNMVMW